MSPYPGPGVGGLLASPALVSVLVFVCLWDFIWKAIALWKAARRRQLVWYIALVILNTIGVLPIVYIFAIAPRQPER